jgi:hypothetical protein
MPKRAKPIPDVRRWLRKLDHLNAEPFMKAGRKQPKTPRRKILT